MHIAEIVQNLETHKLLILSTPHINTVLLLETLRRYEIMIFELKRTQKLESVNLELINATLDRLVAPYYLLVQNKISQNQFDQQQYKARGFISSFLEQVFPVKPVVNIAPTPEQLIKEYPEKLLAFFNDNLQWPVVRCYDYIDNGNKFGFYFTEQKAHSRAFKEVFNGLKINGIVLTSPDTTSHLSVGSVIFNFNPSHLDIERADLDKIQNTLRSQLLDKYKCIIHEDSQVYLVAKNNTNQYTPTLFKPDPRLELLQTLFNSGYTSALITPSAKSTSIVFISFNSWIHALAFYNTLEEHRLAPQHSTQDMYSPSLGVVFEINLETLEQHTSLLPSSLVNEKTILGLMTEDQAQNLMVALLGLQLQSLNI